MCMYTNHLYMYMWLTKILYTPTTPTHRGEVVVSAGEEEAIICTDIGELLLSCHQYCVTRWSPITRFRSCWWCVSASASTAAEENWLVHIDRNDLMCMLYGKQHEFFVKPGRTTYICRFHLHVWTSPVGWDWQDSFIIFQYWHFVHFFLIWCTSFEITFQEWYMHFRSWISSIQV